MMRVRIIRHRLFISGRLAASAAGPSRSPEAVNTARSYGNDAAETARERVRRNQFGIVMLPEEMRNNLFSKNQTSSPSSSDKRKKQTAQQLQLLARAHLEHHGIKVTTSITNADAAKDESYPSVIKHLRLPPLLSSPSKSASLSKLATHIHSVGLRVAAPYLDMAEKAANIPQASWPAMPSSTSSSSSSLSPSSSSSSPSSASSSLPNIKTWVEQPGWTRYAPNEAPRSVPYPPADEEMLFADAETAVRDGPHPVMFVALSDKAWYVWLSERILAVKPDSDPAAPPLSNLEMGKLPKPSFTPFSNQDHVYGNGIKSTVGQHRLIIGQRISFDRARIKEEYSLQQSCNRFLDISSLHASIGGLSSQQKGMWLKWHSQMNRNRSGSSKLSPNKDHAEESDVADSFAVINHLETEEETEGRGHPWMWHSSTSSLAVLSKFYCGVELSKEQRSTFVECNLPYIRHKLQDLISYCALDVQTTRDVFLKMWPVYKLKCPHPATFAGMILMGSCILPVSAQKWSSYINNVDEMHRSKLASVNHTLQELALHTMNQYADKYSDDPWLKHLDWSVKESRRSSKGPPEYYARPKWYRDLYDHVPKSADELPRMSIGLRVVPSLARLTWDGYPIHVAPKKGAIFAVPRAKYEENRKYFERVEPVADNTGKDNDTLYFHVPHKDGWGHRVGTVLAQHYLGMYEKGRIGSEINIVKNMLDITTNCSYWTSNRDRIMGQLVATEGAKKWMISMEFTNSSNESASNSLSLSSPPSPSPSPSSLSSSSTEASSDSAITKKKSAKSKSKSKAKATAATESAIAVAESSSISSTAINSSPLSTTVALSLKPQSNALIANETEIKDRLTVFESVDGCGASNEKNENAISFIIPDMVVCGTVTRRATENTWMTASNPKKNRIGSELKTMVQAPPGFCIVGADVDSEELWIGALLGDSMLGDHGATALSYTVLMGEKKFGTDMHSITAKILNISRDDAKVFNYGRMYGSGLKHAAGQLRKLTDMNEAEADILVKDLFTKTKGRNARVFLPESNQKEITETNSSTVSRSFKPPPLKPLKKQQQQQPAQSHQLQPLSPPPPQQQQQQQQHPSASLTKDDPNMKRLWLGGTESFMFNKMSEIVGSANPRTPFLGCGLSNGLSMVGDDEFTTSRINWVVQSSGVDYLHLLVTLTKYLCDEYNIDARLMLTIHDEIRFVARIEDQYRTALALQISNLWVRAFFSESMGMTDLPLSVAFFSAVDIDSVLRKEPDQSCITPSNPVPIPPGQKLDMEAIVGFTQGKLENGNEQSGHPWMTTTSAGWTTPVATATEVRTYPFSILKRIALGNEHTKFIDPFETGKIDSSLPSNQGKKAKPGSSASNKKSGQQQSSSNTKRQLHYYDESRIPINREMAASIAYYGNDHRFPNSDDMM